MDAHLSITSNLDAFTDAIEDALDLTQPGVMEGAALESMDVYQQAMRDRYDAAAAGDGTWAPHAPSTVKRRGEGALILIEEGDLRQSMNRGDENHVIEVTESGVLEGTQDPKARYHEDGTSKMPARPILIEPDQQELDAMKTPLVEGVRGSVREAASEARIR